MKLAAKSITAAAVFTALTAVFAQISIPLPFSPVPVTLSLFAVFLSSAVLGKKIGTAVQIAYVLLGACGAPVFQGFSGGAGKVLGPTGGYIISYIFMAYVMGCLIERFKVSGRLKTACVMLVGLLICYFFGTSWLIISAHITVGKALTVAVLPFIPLDLVKIAAASVIAHDLKARLLKANLLPDR